LENPRPRYYEGSNKLHLKEKRRSRREKGISLKKER